jgi:hypothetical protein
MLMSLGTQRLSFLNAELVLIHPGFLLVFNCKADLGIATIYLTKRIGRPINRILLTIALMSLPE